eukprot:TRINITY_DN80961_c0_g1_i1.p1 TRINITY_DN80961_c0_g1~~TRINITY_DN80961_c0_g1_i1.p1  ORF type:complete len:312 (+),score=32.39 TRINITY_DN80961_c0_g1_i1:94-1029(+)
MEKKPSFVRRFARPHETGSGIVQQGPNKGDVQGLLATLGLISALLFPLTIDSYSNVSNDDLFMTDFMYALCSSSEFREFVLWEVSKPEHKFDFNISLGTGKSFDVRQALTSGIASHGTPTTPGIKLDGCALHKDTSMAVHALLTVFPKHLMTIWMLQNMDDLDFFRHSEQVEFMSQVCCVVNFVVVAFCVFLHFSLGMSSIEHSDDESESPAFDAWLAGGGELIFGLTVFLFLGGSITFFYSHSQILLVRSSFKALTMRNCIVYCIALVQVPALVIGAAGAIYAYKQSWRAVGKATTTTIASAEGNQEGDM